MNKHEQNFYNYGVTGSYGEYLKLCRKNRHKTRQEIAKELGVCSYIVKKLEEDKYLANSKLDNLIINVYHADMCIYVRKRLGLNAMYHNTQMYAKFQRNEQKYWDSLGVKKRCTIK